MNRASSKFLALATLAALILISLPVFAQSDLGSIRGFVKDPSGAMVPSAKVTAKNTTGLERQTTTNESGYYAITNIPPGFYALTIEASGFKKFETTGNKLDPGGALSLDASLVVGAASEVVEVSASAAALQTESSSVQKNVTREQIDSLELNGRNPIFMANLVPGTRGGNLAGLSFSFSQGPSNINGARTAETIITYDGAPAVRTRSNGTSLGSMDVDSTSEVQILTANYAPEYGRSSGGQIRMLSRSGTTVSTAPPSSTCATPRLTPIPGRVIIRPAKTSCRRSTTISSGITSAARSSFPANGTRTAASCSGIGARSGSATGSWIATP